MTSFNPRQRLALSTLRRGLRWEFAPSLSLGGRAGPAVVLTRFDYANPSFGRASKRTLQPLVGRSPTNAITPRARLSLDSGVTHFKVPATAGSLQMPGLDAQYSF